MECKPDYVLNLFSVASEAHGYLMALYRDQNKHTAAKDIGERLKIACDEIAANPPAPSPGVTSEPDIRGEFDPMGRYGRNCPTCGHYAWKFGTFPAYMESCGFHGCGCKDDCHNGSLPARPELDKDEGGTHPVWPGFVSDKTVTVRSGSLSDDAHAAICPICGSPRTFERFCITNHREKFVAAHGRTHQTTASWACRPCNNESFHSVSGREKGGLG